MGSLGHVGLGGSASISVCDRQSIRYVTDPILSIRGPTIGDP